MDPDQLVSLETSYSGSTLFSTEEENFEKKSMCTVLSFSQIQYSKKKKLCKTATQNR